MLSKLTRLHQQKIFNVYAKQEIILNSPRINKLSRTLPIFNNLSSFFSTSPLASGLNEESDTSLFNTILANSDENLDILLSNCKHYNVNSLIKEIKKQNEDLRINFLKFSFYKLINSSKYENNSLSSIIYQLTKSKNKDILSNFNQVLEPDSLIKNDEKGEIKELNLILDYLMNCEDKNIFYIFSSYCRTLPQEIRSSLFNHFLFLHSPSLAVPSEKRPSSIKNKDLALLKLKDVLRNEAKLNYLKTELSINQFETYKMFYNLISENFTHILHLKDEELNIKNEILKYEDEIASRTRGYDKPLRLKIKESYIRLENLENCIFKLIHLILKFDANLKLMKRSLGDKLEFLEFEPFLSTEINDLENPEREINIMFIEWCMLKNQVINHFNVFDHDSNQQHQDIENEIGDFLNKEMRINYKFWFKLYDLIENHPKTVADELYSNILNLIINNSAVKRSDKIKIFQSILISKPKKLRLKVDMDDFKMFQKEKALGMSKTLDEIDENDFNELCKIYDKSLKRTHALHNLIYLANDDEEETIDFKESIDLKSDSDATHFQFQEDFEEKLKLNFIRNESNIELMIGFILEDLELTMLDEEKRRSLMKTLERISNIYVYDLVAKKLLIALDLIINPSEEFKNRLNLKNRKVVTNYVPRFLNILDDRGNKLNYKSSDYYNFLLRNYFVIKRRFPFFKFQKKLILMYSQQFGLDLKSAKENMHMKFAFNNSKIYQKFEQYKQVTMIKDKIALMNSVMSKTNEPILDDMNKIVNRVENYIFFNEYFIEKVKEEIEKLPFNETRLKAEKKLHRLIGYVDINTVEISYPDIFDGFE